MTLIQHSSVTAEHYTPPEYIEAAREVMGGIDLDPASTPSVNEAHVRASAIMTKGDDGLMWPWNGRVWLNPPGGKLRRVAADNDYTQGYYESVEGGPGESAAAVWWSKLAYEYHVGRVEQAIFLGFTLEILRTSQAACLWMGDYPFCIPSERIKFLKEVDGEFVSGDQPSHANVIVYLPPKMKGLDGSRGYKAIEEFRRVFSKFGRVRP